MGICWQLPIFWVNSFLIRFCILPLFCLLTINTNHMRTYRLAGLLLLLLFRGLVFGQDSTATDLTKALLAFEEEAYAQALPFFREKVQAFPRDGMYQYYYGVCELYAGSVARAQEALRYASTQKVPVDNYLFLGRTYHKCYEFRKALAFYSRYVSNAGVVAKRNPLLELYKSQTENALFGLREFTLPEVLTRKCIHADSLFSVVEPTGGRLVSQLPFPVDSALAAVLCHAYLPEDMSAGEELILVLNNEGQKDLYRATLVQWDSISTPELMGDRINSPFDEAYPVLSADGATLYFASRGHFSMGDYDIYRSVWNWSEQQWSEAESIGFPINSVADDFYFVPGQDPEVVQFASTRFCDADSLWLFSVRKSHKVIYRDVFAADSLMSVAALEKVQMPKERSEPATATAQNTAYAFTEDANFLQKEAYDSLVQWALVYQVRADSVQWLLADERDQLQTTAQGNGKQQLMQSIVKHEREAYQLQKKADVCYQRVREIEQLNIARNPDLAKKMKQQHEGIEATSARSSQVDVRIVRGEPVPELLQVAAPKRLEKVVPVVDTVVKVQALGLKKNAADLYEGKGIPVDPAGVNGLVYRIQLGAFSRRLSPAQVKGLYPVVGHTIAGRGLVKYFAGEFFLYGSAQEALPMVRKSGFADAFIVARKDGKRLPVKQAKLIEQEALQGRKAAGSQSEAVETRLPGVRFVVRIPAAQDDAALVTFLEDLSVEKEKKWLDQGEMRVMQIGWYATFEGAQALKEQLAKSISGAIEIHALTRNHELPVK